MTPTGQEVDVFAICIADMYADEMSIYWQDLIGFPKS